jgi:Uma2 family endonuclease
LASGVKEVWLIDPDQKTISMQQPERQPIQASEGWLESTFLKGFKIKASWLWDPGKVSTLKVLAEMELSRSKD